MLLRHDPQTTNFPIRTPTQQPLSSVLDRRVRAPSNRHSRTVLMLSVGRQFLNTDIPLHSRTRDHPCRLDLLPRLLHHMLPRMRPTSPLVLAIRTRLPRNFLQRRSLPCSLHSRPHPLPCLRTPHIYRTPRRETRPSAPNTNPPGILTRSLDRLTPTRLRPYHHCAWSLSRLQKPMAILCSQ